jgi:hypothetical protein
LYENQYISGTTHQLEAIACRLILLARGKNIDTMELTDLYFETLDGQHIIRMRPPFTPKRSVGSVGDNYLRNYYLIKQSVNTGDHDIPPGTTEYRCILQFHLLLKSGEEVNVTKKYRVYLSSINRP